MLDIFIKLSGILGTILSAIASVFTIIDFFVDRKGNNTEFNYQKILINNNLYNISIIGETNKNINSNNSILTEIIDEILNAIESFFAELSDHPLGLIFVVLVIIIFLFCFLIKVYPYIFILILVISIICVLVVLFNIINKKIKRYKITLNDIFSSIIWLMLFIILIEHYYKIYLQANSLILNQISGSVLSFMTNYVVSVILMVIALIYNIKLMYKYLRNSVINVKNILLWLTIIVSNLFIVSGFFLQFLNWHIE